VLDRFAIAIPTAIVGTVLLFAVVFIGMPATVGVALRPLMSWFDHLSQGERRILAYAIGGAAFALRPAIVLGIRAYRVQRDRHLNG
jgi:hypothetical protein